MVYIDHDGRVLEKRPWSIQRILEIFIGIWFVIVTFTNSLMAPFKSDDTSDKGNTRRGGWGGGGGGGGSGGGYGPGGGGGGGSNRRIGRLQTTRECNVPGGGCCG